MKVKRYRGDDKRLWVKPIDNEALFKHCAGGAYAVTDKLFKEYVEPLLWVHGVGCIDFNGK
jgi:hypothetical protein